MRLIGRTGGRLTTRRNRKRNGNKIAEYTSHFKTGIISSDLSIPVVSTGSTKELAALEVIKQRISKFTREGNSVKYKFKKSLAEIMRRKQQKI